jgi:hypothetical protein
VPTALIVLVAFILSVVVPIAAYVLARVEYGWSKLWTLVALMFPGSWLGFGFWYCVFDATPGGGRTVLNMFGPIAWGCMTFSAIAVAWAIEGLYLLCLRARGDRRWPT